MPQSETRVCQNCKKSFTIDASDFDFYEKIEVPAPTWCWECRMQRRMSFFPNIFMRMYKRKCNATGKELISIYPPDTIYPVYERNYWFSDKWDSLSYGFDYDFSLNFFKQFNRLQKRVPRYHAHNLNSINCEYCAAATNSKNCYFSTGHGNENCYYSNIYNSKDCVDCRIVINSELCYACLDSDHCFKVIFGQYATNCSESAFLYDCSNCSHCFGCVNLRNKSYHIFNKPYSKEVYFEILKKYQLGCFSQLTQVIKEFNYFKSKMPIRFTQIFNAVNVSGNHIRHTNNCFNCFDVIEVENCKYVHLGGLKLNDSYDIYDSGANSSLLYDIGGCTGYKIFFSNWINNGREVYYSDLCLNCSKLFGCVGLHHKHYCILNKQYTKEEYENLVPKIIEQINLKPYVDSKGRVYRYGEFFPPELSLFAYNETVAQEAFPLTEKQAAEQGYLWRSKKEEKNYSITIKAEELADNIKDVKNEILNQIIGCSQCGAAFRIIPQEFDFYREMNLPLPRLCPICRYEQRNRQRPPLKLWRRKCQCVGKESENGVYKNTVSHIHGYSHCPNEFETSYSPDRPEIIYCEECYQQEFV